MKKSNRRKNSVWLALALFLIMFPLFSQTARKHARLFEFIKNTLFIDVHSHPIAGHIEYQAKDPYPTLEPPINRPFWPLKKERIAVFDSLQVKALREIYEYQKKNVTENDLTELGELSQEFWNAGKKKGFNQILDICGIEKVFSNSAFPKKDLDPGRVFWVPFVDFLLYPFKGSELRAISPELQRNLDYSSQNVWELSEKYNLKIEELTSYLSFIDKVLDDFLGDRAVALKVASGYVRTLWFEEQNRNEVAFVFEEGLKGKLASWRRYKKLQDFIARYIFRKAGALKLPVHFHTGFGAVAGLKNLDSNPLNLESVFSDIRFQETQFLILHGGYPSWDTLKPILEKRNAYVEFSAINWFTFEHELAKILHDWLCYPGASEKIMFGSDGGAPVFFWIAAQNSREALYRALAKLIDRGIIDEEKAVMIAERIMRKNAIRLHHLD
ncbi:MAG: amidohydrolase family protein [Candidatus Aminicenantes bacterium]|nr:amidohydrolase family protein [Candidatus Aminicenantes bacterium]